MKSSPEEIKKAYELIRQTEQKIAELVAAGMKVHLIFDFDGVLASPLSEDILELTGGNLAKYFDYETRLIISPPRPGIWLPLAKKVGSLHETQDIVTARSSFLAFRVMMFCMWHCGDNHSQWVRWILPVGHQPKSGSFKIILDSFKSNPDVFIFFIDDTKKHVDAFHQTSADLAMTERTAGIVSPKIREYTKEQLQWHYERIMEANGENPEIVPGTPGGYSSGFLTLPNRIKGFRSMMVKNFYDAEREGAIKQFGPLLKMTFRDLFPDEPVTPEGLHFAFRYLQEEAIHDTSMIQEIMEDAAYLEQKGGADKET